MTERSGRKLLPASLVIAGILLISLWGTGAGRELWYSERFVTVIAAQPLRDMMDVLRFENNPPFLFLLAKLWHPLVGNNETALRLLSLMPALGFLAALHTLTRRIAGKTVAAAATALAAVAAIVVDQSAELRMYPWLMLWTTLAMLLAWSYVARPARRTIALFALVNTLGMYTHYTYVIVFVFLTAWLWWAARADRKGVVVAVAACVASVAPWFIVSVLPKLQSFSASVGVQRLSANPLEIFLAPVRFIAESWIGEPLPLKLLRHAVAAAIGAALVLSFHQDVVQKGSDRRSAVLLWGLLAFGLLVLGASSLSLPKYATVLAPVALILVARGATQAAATLRVRPAHLALFAVGVAVMTAYRVQQPFVAYQPAAALVAQQERSGDRLLIYPFNDEIALRPYYRGGLDVIGFLPLRKPGEVTLRDNIEYNFRVTVDQHNVIQLADYVGAASRVWFFYDVPPTPGYWRADLIAGWFSRNGFQPTVYREVFQNVPPLLIRYDRRPAGTT